MTQIRRRSSFPYLGLDTGIGMSQYGAELMAQEGERWQSIVLHYYPGCDSGVVLLADSAKTKRLRGPGCMLTKSVIW